jgi:hypothetical protein
VVPLGVVQMFAQFVALLATEREAVTTHEFRQPRLVQTKVMAQPY